VNAAIPSGWVRAGLLDVADLIRGVTYSKAVASDVPTDEGVPILRATNIQNRKLLLDDLVYVPRDLIGDDQIVRCGDIVIATSSGSIDVVGKAAQATDDLNAAFGAFCGLLRAKDGIEPRYLGHYLQTPEYRGLVSSLARGVNINNLKRSHFEQIQIPVPPLAEQTRIADTLDRLLATVDTCKTRLDAIPAILKRFRQSVLAAATSGELTEGWRQGRKLENATNLVIEAVEARRQRQEHEVARSRRAVRRPAKSTETEPREFAGATLPESWTWTVSENLCEKIIDGTHHTPTYVDGGIPFLSAKNIHGFEVNFEDCKFIRAEEHRELVKRCRAVRGSLLVTKSGTIGRVAVVGTDAEFSLFESVAVLTPSTPRVSAHYLGYVIAHYCMQGDEHSLIKGTAVRHLHLEDLRRVRIPLPSAVEQEQIVERVQALFLLANRVGEKASLARDHLESLSQEILRKAFAGELTSQRRSQRGMVESLSASGPSDAAIALTRTNLGASVALPQKRTGS
jgi:type I restriction enzyme, S subunit